MERKKLHLKFVIHNILLSFLALSIFGCGKQERETSSAETDTLVLGAYTVPKETYEKEIIPAFQKYWKEETGKELKVEQSYVGSGAQARAIIGGFEADVAALSLEGDIEQIQKEGLITHNWKDRPWKGIITRSVAVIGLRPGNPWKIKDWEDLDQPDLSLLYPNPKTSGGAMWDIIAVYGAGLKMSEEKKGIPDPAYARDLLKRVQKRVKVMDKSGRLSMTTFERGIGDALITYENEILLRGMEGRECLYVIPRSTILIENPVAVVDRYAEKHGVRVLAEEFVKFLHEDFAQRAFARYGYRTANPEIAKEFQEKYPAPPLLFNIDYLGGWEKVMETIFGPEGVWTQISQEQAEGK